MEIKEEWTRNQEATEHKTTTRTPKSGDITRCVNVVDNLGFPPVRMDNQQRFVDKTMIWQCETFKNVKLG